MRDGSKIEKPYYNHDIEAELNQIIPKEKYKDCFVTMLSNTEGYIIKGNNARKIYNNASCKRYVKSINNKKTY